MDETWIHHYTRESKQQSKQKPVVQRQRRQGRFHQQEIALVFWDAEGILFIDYFEKGKTINGEYYSSLLTRLDENICEKSPSLQKKKNHFSSERCTHPQKCFGNGKIKGSAL
jgi:hypothetical protein